MAFPFSAARGCVVALFPYNCYTDNQDIRYAKGQCVKMRRRVNMVQTYQGYFEDDGRFVPEGVLVKLPIGKRAIVNVFDEDAVSEPNRQRQAQRKAFEEFFAAMETLNEDGVELLDDEFDKILSEKVNITRELHL